MSDENIDYKEALSSIWQHAVTNSIPFATRDCDLPKTSLITYEIEGRRIFDLLLALACRAYNEPKE